MALATQCPYCHTTFRVAQDQLKLRAGLVRCGACKQIFNGIENLLRAEAPQPAPIVSSPQEAENTTGPVATSDMTGEVLRPETAPASGPDAQEAPTEAGPPATEMNAQAGLAHSAQNASVDNPLLRMTLMDFTHDARASGANMSTDRPAEGASTDQPDALEKALDDLDRSPWRDTSPHASQDGDTLDLADDHAYEEPGFVRQGRRRQRIARISRLTMAIGLPILFALLILQSMDVVRNQVAARYPQTRPVLVQACNLIGCTVGLPAQIDAVSIESSDLQMLVPERNLFGFTALLRNRSSMVQAWPSIELTLNDTNEKPVVRRVLAPRDYLASLQVVDGGFAPGTEQSVKLAFELTQPKASGYRVYLFYP